MNVCNWLISTAERMPHKTAILFEDDSYTYKELKFNVLSLAKELRRQGFKEKMNIGLMMHNSPDYIISYFAILSIGATAVPINPLFKENEVVYILRNSNAIGILTDNKSINTIININKEVEALNNIVCSKLVEQTNDKKVKFLLNANDDNDNEENDLNSIYKSDMDDVAHIIFTSGTTGNPKGVMITHANLNWLSITEASILNVSSKDKVLCTLPLYHVYGNLQCMLSPFVNGATVIIKERFVAKEVLETIEKERITMFFGVPTMFAMLVQSPLIEVLDFSSLRVCGSGGASIATEIIKKIKQLMNIDILEGYGLTEGTAQVTMNPYNGIKKIGSVGLPIPGVELKITDENNNEVDIGVIGELQFRGPIVMKGYYNNSRATEEIIKENWLSTGDLAYKDKDGYIFIVDRKKDLIIRGGYNIYPREVEEILYQHPNIVECAVIGIPNELYGEEIVAYIVCRNDFNEKEIIEHCKKYLVHYKIPRIFKCTEELPKSAIGKILKRNLKEINFSI